MITLPKLPYNLSDFEPNISQKAMDFHYTKHHQNYIQKTNDLIANTSLTDKSLNDIILTAASDSIYATLFNNAAQVFNHNFFWKSLSPHPTHPTKLMPFITQDFQNIDSFYAQFLEKGLSQFGSGWLWLILTPDKRLKIITTSNANTPLTQGNLTLLLCLDLWEHAYYLDYQNRRADYLDALISHHMNWDFAELNFSKTD